MRNAASLSQTADLPHSEIFIGSYHRSHERFFTPLLLAITLTFFGAGMVKGVTGMGLPRSPWRYSGH